MTPNDLIDLEAFSVVQSLFKRFSLSRRPELIPVLLFAMEGALLQYTNSINSFGNNLFATNLGATDAQIGLVQMVPNAVAVLLMLPMGILADRAKSSRTLPLVVLLCMAVGYVLMGMVPWMGAIRMQMFFVALGFTVGGPVLYNAQWQSFFGDVVVLDQRNNVLALRNRAMFVVGIAAPLLCGVLMGTQAAAEGKLLVLQLFFFACAAVTLLQAAAIARIPTPDRTEARAHAFSMRDVGDTVRLLAKNRAFLMFFVPSLLFYMTWQLDWSMWYIGQVQYLMMTEAQLSMVNGAFNIGQLVAVGILAKVVRRRGSDYTLIFAGFGLIMCPIVMMFSSMMPLNARFLTFTVLLTILNAPQCAINLCVVQILLRVAPEKNRALVVSLYTLTTTLTNCFMPYLGVQLYTMLGGDYRAMIIFNCTVLALRLVTTALLILRYRYLHRQGGLEQGVA